MATFLGKGGTVQVGSNAIAEIRSYSIDETTDVIEDSSMGDSSKTYLVTLKDFSGTVDVLFDDTDTNGQTALSVGSSVTLNFAPEGTGSGAVLTIGLETTIDGAEYSIQQIDLSVLLGRII